MALTTEGVKQIARAVVDPNAAFNSANSYVGVGNGTTAFSVDQTDLQGTEKIRKVVDPGYPAQNAPSVTFRATFAKNEANFEWNEWAIFNAATGGVMLNRQVESNGTKQDNQTWLLEATITFSVA